ncbi:redoxin domain-containing protein [Spirosoma sp. KCTC 42546]|uniref:TlpA family protein disulfide reductase n=1 Tax=Spirosoma sp. KCTC 42546 TaxID=2520506 RepID=UPI00115A8F67|nr:redoxin domain-containing protein [Spirosoma sp. KCTC 42546]QDK81015.1 redoxin domain-containing protein [Spirosoma sp. KCTC 42546]
MKHVSIVVFITAVQALICFSTLAQVVVSKAGIRQEVRIDESTKIVDKTTGKQISYQAYRQLMQKDPYGYHVMPVFDEYGKASAYMIRPTTAEERETHIFYNELDPTLQPKVGEPIPLFVMKGIDDKVYRSTDLKGHVVILSFWVSLSKPFWGPSQANQFADVIRPYQSDNGLISLGILRESKEEIANVMATQTLPFMPIPDSYSFNRKFQVASIPSFIVIDKAGNIAAFVNGSDYDQLKQVIQHVSRN